MDTKPDEYLKSLKFYASRKLYARQVALKLISEQIPSHQLKLAIRSREKVYIDVRSIVAKKMDKMGFSSILIGYALGRDHTTVLAYLKRVDEPFIPTMTRVDTYTKSFISLPNIN